ncbi:MAG: restriction endonuclease [Alphaproteobacteria bacterium]
MAEKRLNRWRGLRRGVDYEITGIPRDITGAKKLFETSPHQFQLWALTLVDAQACEGGKKGADAGVDGIIYFQDSGSETGRAIVSVKGGERVGPTMIRDLIGTVENERARAGVFVTLTPPTPKMEEAANAAGLVEGGRLIPKIQIRTVADLLRHQKPDLPPVYDVLSAATAARRAAQIRPQLSPTPEQLRRQPELPPMSLPGGAAESHRPQPALPLDEPLLTNPQGFRSRRRS